MRNKELRIITGLCSVDKDNIKGIFIFFKFSVKIFNLDRSISIIKL